jgi:hypothetical protein
MSPRTIRRAAERRALKEARKTANRANSQFSTGPRSEEGKAVSSQNALKTGLTGRTVLLPNDDSAAFEQHVAAYHSEYRPAGLRETELVQSLAETRWRLNRIVTIEAALFAQQAEAAEGEEDTPAPAALDCYLKHEKTLKNLHLQEARLNRRFEKDLAELRELQKERHTAELISAAAGQEFPPQLTEWTEKNGTPGFEFSTAPNTIPTALAAPLLES